mgnify:CR=1 FL=1
MSDDTWPAEVVPAPPMTAHEHRLILAGSFEAVRLLLPHSDAPGLARLRLWLRHPSRVEISAGVALADTRVALLEATCERLIELGAGSLEYFVAAGDMFAGVPDDLSELST